MSLRVTYKIITGQWEENLRKLYEPMAKAGTTAIDQVVDEVKTDARANIASAGFSKKWQNALRIVRFPKRKISLNAAAFLWHKIPYADIFEKGGTIKGSPLIWLPLDTTPKKLGRKRFTPRNFEKQIGHPLVTLANAKVPLLGVRVRISKRQAKSDRPKASLAAIKRGASEGNGVLRTIPLFHGVRSVNIRDKFSIREICEKARNSLASKYLAALNRTS